MTLDALRRRTAVELRAMLVSREISAVELMQAVLASFPKARITAWRAARSRSREPMR